MSKLKTTIAFLTGAAIGGAAVWYVAKERYARIAQEEIDSVKEAYAKREALRGETISAEKMDDPSPAEEPQTDISPTILTASKVEEKGSISAFAAKRAKDGGYVDYSSTVVPAKAETAEEVEATKKPFDEPYVISPDEFDEIDGYMAISLTYYSDDILADENGVIVDDKEEIVGDALQHFGEYEDDAVFVRNDAKRCDYEILRDEGTYAEFRKTLPPNI